MSAVGLLVYVFILVLVFAAVVWIIEKTEAFAKFKNVLYPILGVIAIVLLLGLLFGGFSFPGLKVTSNGLYHILASV